MLLAIQILLGVLFAGTGIGLVVDLGKNRMDELKGSTGKQWASAFTVGIIANFLDTLGCGSYAPSTFMYKLFNQIDDIDIPGTLNIGDTFPVIFEAFIFTTSVECDPLFLWVMLFVQLLVHLDLHLSLQNGHVTKSELLLDVRCFRWQ